MLLTTSRKHRRAENRSDAEILAILDGLDVQNMLKIIELSEKHCTALKEGIFQVLTGRKTQTPDTDEPGR